MNKECSLIAKTVDGDSFLFFQDNNIALEALTGPVMKLEPMCVPALDANAAFGLTHLLAIMNERIWPVAVPVFGKLLIPQWKSLPDSYALLLNKFLRVNPTGFES